MTLIPEEELKNPFAQGAATASAFSGTSDTMLASELANLAKTIGKGDLSHAEEILMVQAEILDAIFNHLAQKAAQRLTGTGPNTNIQGTERYLRLAMKAQSQCRSTLETLARIKSPPVVYAQQANISNGPQQVNNGPREDKNEQNQLLEAIPNERLDFGATKTTGGTNQVMESMGEVNRPSD